MIFDTHAHYDSDKFDEDRESVIAALAEAGVGCVVNIGADPAGSENSVKLAETYKFFYAAAGVHPDSVGELEQMGEAKADAWFQQILSHPKVKAIGEIGLDYYWNKESKECQQKWFRFQMDIARKRNLPIIIHSREAAADTLRMIQEAGGNDLSMVIHCFSYEKEMAARYLDMGHYLGIGGVVTYKNGRKLKDVVSYAPVDRLLLETDCPYLSPVPHRGEKNWSGNLSYVVDEIAALKGISREEVEDITWQNAMRFYRLQDIQQQ